MVLQISQGNNFIHTVDVFLVYVPDLILYPHLCAINRVAKLPTRIFFLLLLLYFLSAGSQQLLALYL